MPALVDPASRLVPTHSRKSPRRQNQLEPKFRPVLDIGIVILLNLIAYSRKAGRVKRVSRAHPIS